MPLRDDHVVGDSGHTDDHNLIVDAIGDLQAADTAEATARVAGDNARQPLDADLTAIAALDSATAGALVTDGAGWIRKTYAQLKSALGLDNVDNTSDANKPVSTATAAAISALSGTYQPLATMTESVQDIVGAAITAGSNITVTYDDGTGLTTIAGTVTALTQEQVEDFVGAMQTDSSTIDFTYTDATGQITAVVKAASVTPAMIAATGTPSSSTFLRGDGAWQAPSSTPTLMIPGPIPVSGRFLQAPPDVLSIFNSNTFTDQILYAVPVPIWAACTLNAIQAYVNTVGSGGTVRLGLYADDGAGNPTTLLLDAGTFNQTSSGQQSFTISQAIASPRMLWAATVYQGAAVTMAKLMTTYTDYRKPIIPSGSAVNNFQNQASGSNQQVGWKSSAGIGTGALPGTFPAKTAITEQYAPVVGLGVA